MYAISIQNAVYSAFLEIMWQLCALYNILRGIFNKIFPPARPARTEPDGAADAEWFSISYISGGLDAYDVSSPRPQDPTNYKINTTSQKLIETYYSNFADADAAYAAIPFRDIHPRVLFLHHYSNGKTRVLNGAPRDEPEPPAASKRTIIFAEYRHPEMNEPLEFTNLATRYSLTGNELFSPVFVMRYLEYNFPRGSYVFDENYSITVMDNEMNVYQGVVVL